METADWPIGHEAGIPIVTGHRQFCGEADIQILRTIYYKQNDVTGYCHFERCKQSSRNGSCKRLERFNGYGEQNKPEIYKGDNESRRRKRLGCRQLRSIYPKQSRSSPSTGLNATARSYATGQQTVSVESRGKPPLIIRLRTSRSRQDRFYRETVRTAAALQAELEGLFGSLSDLDDDGPSAVSAALNRGTNNAYG